MDIWEIDTLALFIAFVIPGFISIKAYQLAFPGTERATSDQLVDAVAYSSINYALLIFPIISVESGTLSEECRSIYYLFYIFVLFVAPIIWVLLWKYLRTRNFFQRNAPHPTAKPWDYVFAQRKPYWIKVTLKDGAVIAGRYADKSFASSAPAPEQIYLEETWVLNQNGGFERPKNNTAGVLILSSEISHVELRS
ncbi:hypothetical protein GCM10007421_15600 [Halopseudomonas oceani]|uniref:Uncharacterized protein n=1 Tax=Halopseudomonas oceani TaxID=1708783 RepID=A0A2P4EZA8_9GAMM|nr:DUF6338 family protein [Halopseudomonas oceani]POB05795.1 hypothetical protein C1949_03685 [Halopseudomonas oceani]GGE42336.1 hypothetical protein GCM10007421_15600 [Halopseudomonas oceani]